VAIPFNQSGPAAAERGPLQASLGGDHILTLDEAAGVLPRPDVPEDDVAL
jgi:hypothetical protein